MELAKAHRAPLERTTMKRATINIVLLRSTFAGHMRSSLCNLCVLCVSVVIFSSNVNTETQRTQRLHREAGKKA